VSFAARRGRVHAAVGESVIARLPGARVGEAVTIRVGALLRIPATVTRVGPERVELLPHTSVAGVGIGDEVVTDPLATTLPLGMRLLGRVIDSGGSALDALGRVRGRRAAVIDPPIDAGLRRPVERPLWTGIKAIDGLITIGRGARIGIFGGPATGKSLMIEALVRGAAADAVVVGLIGERGGEAAAWMQRISQHATIVCSPSDRSPTERVRAAHVALAQASQLRRRGLNVLVVLDSLARFALAAREIALRNGEAVGRGGYPPSVFTEMTRLLERGGNVCGGSVTLIATVLSDGPDEREPLSDAARSALDGHIVLSPKLARAGLFPAIDVAASASRTMDAAVSAEHRRAARIVRRAVAQLDATRELRDLGFTHTDRHLERAVALQEHIEAFIHHGPRAFGPAETLAELRALAEQLHLDTP
jgi:FliI/YscN family ATPase